MKVPVVSTSVGGIPEVIQHGETGMLSESENADELAEHVSKIMSDDRLRETIVENAFRVAHEKFSQDAMLTQIRDSYMKTCDASYERDTNLGETVQQ